MLANNAAPALIQIQSPLAPNRQHLGKHLLYTVYDFTPSQTLRSDFWRYDRIIDLNYHQRQTAPFRFPAPFCAVMKPCASGPQRTFYGIWTGACRRPQTQTSRLSTGRTLSYELIMRIKRAPRKHKTGMKDKLQLHQKYSMFTHILLLWFTI